MRGKIVSIVAIVASLTASVVVASAAGIGPIESRLFSATGPVTFTTAERSISAVTLATTGSPATITSASIVVNGSTLTELNGQALQLMLLDSSNAVVTTVNATLATGTNLTIGAGSATVALAVPGSVLRSSVTGWAVFIAGSQVLNPTAPSSVRTVAVGNGTLTVVVSTWQQLLVQAGNTQTQVDSVTLTSAAPGQACVTIGLSSAASGNNPVTWALNFDYNAGPFWGTAPTGFQKTQVQSTTGTVMRLVGITGSGGYNEWTNNAEIRRNNGTLTIILCNNNMPAPPNRAEAYTTSAQFVPAPWTSAKACIAKTVTGNDAYPFYFGWQVSLDSTAAMAYLRTFDPASPDAIEYTPNTYSPTLNQAVTTYTVNNYRDSAISGTGSYTATLCFMNY